MLLYLIPATCFGGAAQQVRLTPERDSYESVMAVARTLCKQGNPAAAVAEYQKAQRIASANNDLTAESGALLGEGSCYLRLFRYREALDVSERAFSVATQARDYSHAGAAAGNKAAVYDQLGDVASASVAAEQAVNLLEHSPRRNYYAQALLSDGDIQGLLHRPAQSFSLFKRAIAVAQQAKIPETEALADDHLGFALLTAGDYIMSRSFLEQARKLRIDTHDPQLLVTQVHLAELAYKTGDYRNGLKLIDGVLESSDNAASTIVHYWPPQMKGKLLLAMGRRDEAMPYFTTAVQLADEWRRDVLPSASTGLRTDVLLSAAYDDYIRTAAAMAAERSDAALARKALAVVIANRAWSLRDQLLAARSREMRLPPRYYELLSELQAAQATVTLARTGPAQQHNKDKLERIRLELSDLENKIGIQQQNISLSREKDAHRTSLRNIQFRLGREDLLLSFYLGADKSFLWTLTSDRVKLYELPASSQIAQQARAFKLAVENRGSAGQAGGALSRSLFSQLSAPLMAKRNWLIAGDGALLDGVPFSSLPTPAGRHLPLVAKHTLRMIVSEALLDSPQRQPARPVFVGVGDPIYNSADSRLHRGVPLVPVSDSHASFSLGRLVASEREIGTAAQATGLPSAFLLTGAEASGAGLARVLSQPPQILHFAVHVVSPDHIAGEGDDSDQAALALSLTGDSIPELLTRESIAALRVPGTLVVLSGCASQQGAVLPSAGMVGLSRAWLLAGASAVLVTAWPTPDDSGAFFKVFYTRFHKAAGTVSQRAAAALQQTQSEMMSSSGYRSDAAFWSAYSLISKE